MQVNTIRGSKDGKGALLTLVYHSSRSNSLYSFSSCFLYFAGTLFNAIFVLLLDYNDCFLKLHFQVPGIFQG